MRGMGDEAAAGPSGTDNLPANGCRFPSFTVVNRDRIDIPPNSTFPWLRTFAASVDFWISPRQNGYTLVHLTDREGACHDDSHTLRRDADLFLKE
jgi:hypothetical protein